nr:HAMP domain-containing sensor histidine kinase [uncultured Merdimonas sp.]
MIWLGGSCLILAAAVILLSVKIWSMRRAAFALKRDLKKKLSEDTNVGLEISCGDHRMRELAAELDCQMESLRKARLRYELGDQEVKTAVTNISHDLRTPLTAISGYLQLLKNEEVPIQVREYLDIIENRTDAMKRLTEELFSYSVVVSEEQYRHKEKLLLKKVLEDSIAGMYGALTERNIQVKTELTEEKIYVEADREALMRIFGNVIHNVVKYSDGDLVIRLKETGEASFSNHASSLSEVEAGKLFQRFFTVQSGRESTGLGLSIARALTEQMGGKIQAEKEEEWFTIRILFQAVVKSE